MPPWKLSPEATRVNTTQYLAFNCELKSSVRPLAEVAKAVELLNNDKDWRFGMRVRGLVKPGVKKKQNQPQQKQKQVGTDGWCSPRHHTSCEPSYLESNGTL